MNCWAAEVGMNTIIKQKTFLVGAVFLIGLSSVFAQAQGSKPLNIGIIGKLTNATAHGVELAVERFNQQGNITTPDGGVFKLTIIAQDAATADDVGNAITTLKNQGVVAIFGPDDATLALASLNTLNNAGVPVFTSVQDPAVTTGGLLFRTRANDSRNMTALVNYLTKDLGKSQIAVFQGDQAFQARVQLFTTTITQNNLKAATTVVQVPGGTVASSAQVLLQGKPDAVIAFGANDQVAALLQELHSQSYTGVVVYPDAVDHTFISSLTSDMRSGIIGVTNWVYSSLSQDSRSFVDDYVALFGESPTAESAAAYDAAVALFKAIQKSGLQPDAIKQALLTFPKTPSIQGDYDPAIGNNELSADVVVFTTGEYGAPIMNALLDETGRLPLPGIATPTATMTPTPAGVSATAKETSNVHGGPGVRYPVLGQLPGGQTVNVIGINATGNWLLVIFAGRRGWVALDRVSVSGNLQALPVVAAPPLPTATRQPTATLPPYPNLRLLNAVINPAIPHQGQPFTVTLTIQNQGTVAAGQFAVAASFLPGNVFSAAIVPGLQPGATTTAVLKATVKGGSGKFTVAIVIDLNNQVNEGPFSANKKVPFSYTIQ